MEKIVHVNTLRVVDNIACCKILKYVPEHDLFSLSPVTQHTLALAFLPRLCCHGESMWFPGVAMGISSTNISFAIICLSFYDLFLFSVSITLPFSVFPCDRPSPCWGSWVAQLAWLCKGQSMSPDSLRMKVFSGWPWASVTSPLFSLISHILTGRFTQMNAHLGQKWSANGYIIVPTHSASPTCTLYEFLALAFISKFLR